MDAQEIFMALKGIHLKIGSTNEQTLGQRICNTNSYASAETAHAWFDVWLGIYNGNAGRNLDKADELFEQWKAEQSGKPYRQNGSYQSKEAQGSGKASSIDEKIISGEKPLPMPKGYESRTAAVACMHDYGAQGF